MFAGQHAPVRGDSEQLFMASPKAHVLSVGKDDIDRLLALATAQCIVSATMMTLAEYNIVTVKHIAPVWCTTAPQEQVGAGHALLHCRSI